MWGALFLMIPRGICGLSRCRKSVGAALLRRPAALCVARGAGSAKDPVASRAARIGVQPAGAKPKKKRRSTKHAKKYPDRPYVKSGKYSKKFERRLAGLPETLAVDACIAFVQRLSGEDACGCHMQLLLLQKAKADLKADTVQYTCTDNAATWSVRLPERQERTPSFRQYGVNLVVDRGGCVTISRIERGSFFDSWNRGTLHTHNLHTKPYDDNTGRLLKVGDAIVAVDGDEDADGIREKLTSGRPAKGRHFKVTWRRCIPPTVDELERHWRDEASQGTLSTSRLVNAILAHCGGAELKLKRRWATVTPRKSSRTKKTSEPVVRHKRPLSQNARAAVQPGCVAKAPRPAEAGIYPSWARRPADEKKDPVLFELCIEFCERLGRCNVATALQEFIRQSKSLESAQPISLQDCYWYTAAFVDAEPVCPSRVLQVEEAWRSARRNSAVSDGEVVRAAINALRPKQRPGTRIYFCRLCRRGLRTADLVTQVSCKHRVCHRCLADRHSSIQSCPYCFKQERKATVRTCTAELGTAAREYGEALRSLQQCDVDLNEVGLWTDGVVIARRAVGGGAAVQQRVLQRQNLSPREPAGSGPDDHRRRALDMRCMALRRKANSEAAFRDIFERCPGLRGGTAHRRLLKPIGRLQARVPVDLLPPCTRRHQPRTAANQDADDLLSALDHDLTRYELAFSEQEVRRLNLLVGVLSEAEVERLSANLEAAHVQYEQQCEYDEFDLERLTPEQQWVLVTAVKEALVGDDGCGGRGRSVPLWPAVVATPGAGVCDVTASQLDDEDDEWIENWLAD